MRRSVLRLRRQEPEESVVDLTPLMDVVFIMLIFFVVTASFVAAPGITVEKPTAATGTDQQPLAGRIGVDRAGRLFAEGRPLRDPDFEAQVRLLLVATPQGGLLLEADAAVPSGRLIELIDRANAVGAPSVSVAVRGPRGESEAQQ